jgi:glycine cleavage system H protein
MSQIPDTLRYTEEHEYVRDTDEEGEVLIGITDYAQGELGDVVYVELPEVGDSFERMDAFGTIEAVKAVSDLYSPVAGEVVGVNGSLEDDPGLVNSDPYGDGWMIRLRVTEPGQLTELLDAAGYKDFLDKQG